MAPLNKEILLNNVDHFLLLKMSNNLQQVSLFHFTKIPLGKNFQSSVSQRPYKGLILVTSPPTF